MVSVTDMEDRLARARTRRQEQIENEARIAELERSRLAGIDGPSWHAGVVSALHSAGVPQVAVHQVATVEKGVHRRIGLTRARKFGEVTTFRQAPFAAWILGYLEDYETGTGQHWIFVSTAGPRAGTVHWEINQDHFEKRHPPTRTCGLPPAGGWVRAGGGHTRWSPGQADYLDSSCGDGIVAILLSLEEGRVHVTERGDLLAEIAIPEMGWG
jgi:hypothetical protein